MTDRRPVEAAVAAARAGGIDACDPTVLRDRVAERLRAIR